MCVGNSVSSPNELANRVKNSARNWFVWPVTARVQPYGKEIVPITKENHSPVGVAVVFHSRVTHSGCETVVFPRSV